MKTKEELKTLTRELEALNKKLAELSEEELEEVCGGIEHPGSRDYTDMQRGSEPSLSKTLILPTPILRSDI